MYIYIQQVKTGTKKNRANHHIDNVKSTKQICTYTQQVKTGTKTGHTTTLQTTFNPQNKHVQIQQLKTGTNKGNKQRLVKPPHHRQR